MRSSLKLGTVSGIPIGLHWSIALIAGLFTITLAGTILPAAAPGYVGAVYLITAAAVAVALMASIIAHELGHSLVAQNNDVGVSGITLFALGGVAKLEREPDTAGAAARIALAGPAVSVAIGVASMVAAGIAGVLGTSALIVAALTWLGIINLVMAVFNMIPALPLDGGRVLQAALWHRSGDKNKATVSAATVGRYLGWAIVAFGLWQFFSTGSGLWTALIGWFIVGSAKAEEVRARFQQRVSSWAPPQWPPAGAWGPPPTSPPPTTGPGRPGPADAPFTGWAPPNQADVIDVDGRRVG